MADLKIFARELDAGGSRAELFTNILKHATALDKWTVFLRELLQNSLDQASEAEDFHFQVRHLDFGGTLAKKLGAMFDGFSPFDSTELASGKGELKDAIVIVDKGTAGLSGEIDPGAASGKSNFASFFFISGQHHSQTRGGGTYGVGRNVLFSASSLNTAFAYSRFEENGRLRSRFMGMTLTSSYSHAQRNYNGRHWWGSPESTSNLPAPLEDQMADQMAKEFGVEGYLANTTGTCLIVVNPKIEGEKDSVLENIANSILINAWPHLLISSKGKPKKTFAVFDGENEVPIVDPLSADSPVRYHAQAFLALDRDDSLFSLDELELGSAPEKEIQAKYGLKPTDKKLGKLSWSNVPAARYSQIGESKDKWERAGFIARPSVALMRDAKLVVQYLPVAAPEQEMWQIGTFVVNSTYDAVFRKSENVTHDQWVESALELESGGKNPVRITLRKLAEIFQTKIIETQAENGSPSITISNLLGKLQAGLKLTGGLPQTPNPVSTGGGTGNKARRSKITKIGQPRVVSRDSSNPAFLIGEFDFQVYLAPANGASNDEIQFRCHIIVSGRPEIDAPIGAGVPEVLSLFVENNKTSFLGNMIPIGALSQDDRITVTVRYPQGTRVDCLATIGGN